MEEEKIKNVEIKKQINKVYLALYGVSIAIFIATLVYQTSADTVTVFFEKYLQTETEVAYEQEKILKHYELRWNDFSSDIPLETNVSKISLRFSVSNAQMETGTENDIASSTVDGASEATSSPENEVPSDVQDADVVDTTVDTVVVADMEELEQPIDDTASDTTESTVHDTTTTVISDEAQIIDEPEEVIVENEQPDDVSDGATQVLSFSDTASSDVYVSEVLPLDVVVVDTPASTTSVETVGSNIYEVFYSLDGVDWQSIGEGDFSTTQDVVFDLSQISLDQIPSLVIAISYTTDESTNSSVLFSQMRLEVDCLLPEEILEPVLSRPIDLEPNFQNSAVKADVTSENLRAVLVERGSMLELWYGFVDFATKEIQWRQLASDGSLSATTPIAIRERTIFWLDKNQQTLFGFSIDTQSLFGNSLASDTQNTLQLQFVSKTGEMWNVVYSPENNSFEFIKVATHR